MDKRDSRFAIAGYWNSFYAGHEIAAPSQPSPFAKWVNEQLESSVAVVEVGCGNGRDSRFFALHGRPVMAFDQSAEAINLVLEAATHDDLDNLNAAPVSVEELATSATSEQVRGLVGSEQVAVYARFLLHAITEDEQKEFLAWLDGFLRSGESCYLEYRAADLSGDQYVFGNHYRRPVTASELSEQCKALGFDVVASDESRDYAPYRGEYPLVGRTVIRKPVT